MKKLGDILGRIAYAMIVILFIIAPFFFAGVVCYSIAKWLKSPPQPLIVEGHTYLKSTFGEYTHAEHCACKDKN